MKLELEIWQCIVLGTMILSAFWGMARMMLSQNAKALDEKFRANSQAFADRFAAVTKQLDAQDENDKRMGQQLSDMRVEMPRDYVRREDFTRVIATFEVKVDNLRLTIERALLSGVNKS